MTREEYEELKSIYSDLNDRLDEPKAMALNLGPISMRLYKMLSRKTFDHPDDPTSPPSPDPPGPPSATMDRIDVCNLHLGKVEERLAAMERGGWRRIDPSVYEAIDGLRSAVNALLEELREVRGAWR